MRKKIYLTESQLRSVIKRVIEEQSLRDRVLAGASNYYNKTADAISSGVNTLQNTASDVYNTVSTAVSDHYNTVSTAVSDVGKGIWDYVTGIKNLAIIFPNMTEAPERILGSVMSVSLPIVAGPHGWTSYVLDSLSGYHKLVNTLSSKGVKLDKLLIGSHGDGKYLLMTANEGVANANFLSSIKKIITNKTIIYFTACFGAEALRLLYDAALKTNTTVYASTGVNYGAFASEKGFYSCSPIPLSQQDRQQYDEWDYAKKAKGGEGAYNELLIRGGYCKRVSRPPYWFVLPGALGPIIDPIKSFFSILTKPFTGTQQKYLKKPNSYTHEVRMMGNLK